MPPTPQGQERERRGKTRPERTTEDRAKIWRATLPHRFISIPNQEKNQKPLSTTFPKPKQDSEKKNRKFLVVCTKGVAGPMGRPFLLGSRPRGPKHREFNELPALGTAPETQKTRSNLEPIVCPRRMFRRLAHSLIQEHSWDNKPRQRQTFNIPYRYRKHEAHPRRHRPNTETHKSGYRRAPRGGGRTQPAWP